MAENPLVTAPAAESGDGLKIDLRTVAIGLWRRRSLLLVPALISIPLAFAIALGLGEREYRAETVLLNRPVEPTEDGERAVSTQLHLVKVPDNLAIVRQRLGITASLEQLALRVHVAAAKKTDLLVIRGTGPNPGEAARFTNTVREVFLEEHIAMRAVEMARRIAELEARADDIDERLAEADRDHSELVALRGIIDLDKESGAILQEATSLDVLYHQAVANQQALEQRHARMADATRELARKAEAEQEALTGTEDLTSLNIRSGRLRSAIEEDRRQRYAEALLAEKKAELDRATELLAKGVVAQSVYDLAVAEYESQKALAVDTDQTSQWKDELARLDASVIPEQRQETPTGVIMRDLMLRALDVDLDQTAAAERTARLDEARKEVQSRLAELPEQHRDMVSLQRKLEGLENERQTVRTALGQARARSRDGDFVVVSEATPRPDAVTSNRRLLFAAVLALGLGIGLVLLVGAEARDLSIRSGAEVELRLRRHLIATVPRLTGSAARLPDGTDGPVLDHFRGVARRLRRLAPARGVRLLIVSATPGEGTTFVTSQLAAALGRLDERVLVMDAHVRDVTARDEPMPLPEDVTPAASSTRRGPSAWLSNALDRLIGAVIGRRPTLTPTDLSLRQLLPPDQASPRPGLADYLSFAASELVQITTPTALRGVDVVATCDSVTTPDLVGSPRMAELLDEASRSYGVVLIDAPPALALADAEALAPLVDGVVFVTRAQHESFPRLRTALDQIGSVGRPVVGVVLNHVDRAYLRVPHEVFR